MKVDYDPQVDAVYIHLSSEPYAYGSDLDDWRRVDYSTDGRPIGIELLNVSEGVNVSGLPNSREIAKALEAHGIRAYFLEQYAYSTVGFVPNTVILARIPDNRVDILQWGESIEVFNFWVDSPFNTSEKDGEVITA